MHDPHIDQPDNFAAIVPLDYGPDREELSLIFASYDWSQLPELLKDPVKFFEDQSNHWQQNATLGKKHQWKLLSPSTVILQWVGKTQEALGRTAQVATHTVPDEASSRKKAVAGLTEHYGDTDALVSELRNNFPKGFFLAEFAFKTRILFIRYHPAEVRKGEGGKKVRHFTGEFTNATANKMMPFQGGHVAASVHIDIGQTNEDRAHFVMDFIEDCENFFAEALGSAPQFYVGDVPLVQKHGTIEIKTSGDGLRPNVRMANNIPYPTLYMETPPPVSNAGMKGDDEPLPPAECLVCVMSNGQWVNPEDPNSTEQPATYMVGNTVVKCYAPPGPAG